MKVQRLGFCFLIFLVFDGIGEILALSFGPDLRYALDQPRLQRESWGESEVISNSSRKTIVPGATPETFTGIMMGIVEE